MLGEKYYIVKRGNKYLNLSMKGGVQWGKRIDAFPFIDAESASQIACCLASKKAQITIIECEEEV